MTKDPRITVAPDGPDIVTGEVPITSTSPVLSEHGDH